MTYEVQKFDHLIGLEGFSEKMLKNHFTLYEGYVANTQKVADAVTALLDTDKAGTPEFAEMTRRLGWEFNGMRLHELYFENLMKGGSKLEADSPLGKKIVAEFGSFERWEKHFRAIGAMRGIGWVVLYQDNATGSLYNMWISEHNEGHITGATPILVMDVFEHAYMTDYEIKRADYIQAFMQNICWHVAGARFSAAQ